MNFFNKIDVIKLKFKIYKKFVNKFNFILSSNYFPHYIRFHL
jgi:hypothetical protein